MAAQDKKLDELTNAFNAYKATIDQKLDLLDRKVAAINKALSFDYEAVTRKGGVVYNSADNSQEVPKCPSGRVMTCVRHSGYN